MTRAAKSEGVVVRVGGQSRTAVLEALHNAGVQLNLHAETLLAHAGLITQWVKRY